MGKPAGLRVDDLRAIFLFDGLSDEQLLELIAIGDEVRFERGDVLFREGEAADFWWVLVEGRVELLRRSQWEESVAGVMEGGGGRRHCLVRAGRPDTRQRPARARPGMGGQHPVDGRAAF